MAAPPLPEDSGVELIRIVTEVSKSSGKEDWHVVAHDDRL